MEWGVGGGLFRYFGRDRPEENTWGTRTRGHDTIVEGHGWIPALLLDAVGVREVYDGGGGRRLSMLDDRQTRGM